MIKNARLVNDAMEFAGQQTLHALFDIPKLADSIEVVANAMARNVICRLSVDARQDRQRYASRPRWLLSQLPQESDSSAIITCVWDRGIKSPPASLAQLREDPDAGRLDSAGTGPNYFEIAMVTDLASRFAGTRNFVPAVEEAVLHFYETIARHIRPWQGFRESAADDETQYEEADRAAELNQVQRAKRIKKSGQFNGKSFSIFDDGSIEIETGNGVQRFNNFAELTAAAAAKNGRADAGRTSGRGTDQAL